MTFNKIIVSLILLMVCSAIYAQDIIVTNESKRIDAKIIEVSKSEIRYKESDNLEGPTFVLETQDIHTIIYANGKVKLYHQDAPKEQSLPDQIPAQESLVAMQSNIKKDLSLAHVENANGVYIFTDCVPVAAYEVLGNVFFNQRGEHSTMVLPTYHSYAMSVIDIEETHQYTEIRNGLIAQAIMANRQVEGILITIQAEGKGQATLIKFKNSTDDKSLARVNSHLGVYVFTDCMPVNGYSFVGKINGAGGLNSDYNHLRDKLIKKAKNRFPSVQGIIPRFVTGGKDTAEAITF